MLPDRFILYRREKIAGTRKWNKIPCDISGKTIDANAPRNWKPHADVAPYAKWDENQPSAPYGIGFVLNGDGWWFYDLDNCFVEQCWLPWAEPHFSPSKARWARYPAAAQGCMPWASVIPENCKIRRHKWGKEKGQEQEWYCDKRFVALSKEGLSPIGGKYTDKDWTAQLLNLVPQKHQLGSLPEGRDPHLYRPRR